MILKLVNIVLSAVGVQIELKRPTSEFGYDVPYVDGKPVTDSFEANL